ncbi:Homeobox protein GBX-1 [Heracleum sosnowskyi]|uniref:Homeobox protein GBX-1 n=1 Tax=Heracleum sosnowskyi TaxID=360622 RepID=A0AAD8GZE5_9APIA|nr:Homeobox protein GBX-1 [Heracleum sosnowskyi]
MMDDDWVKAARNDGDLVAEQLVRMLHSPPKPPPSILPLKWSVRQPRTRSVGHKSGVARGSPTTPLSWTGGSSSHSGGPAAPAAVDGSEESSRHRPGSKLAAANEATISKRSRKKKTMTELKEEEISMLKENKELKRTLAGLLDNLEKTHSENTSLKRIKLDLASQKPNTARTPKKKTISKACQSMVPPITREDSAALPVMPSSPTRCPEVKTQVEGGSDKFVIPDLNVAFVESNNAGPSEMMG